MVDVQRSTIEQKEKYMLSNNTYKKPQHMGVSTRENLSLGFANKGANQNIFVIRLMESILPELATHKISFF